MLLPSCPRGPLPPNSPKHPRTRPPSWRSLGRRSRNPPPCSPSPHPPRRLRGSTGPATRAAAGVRAAGRAPGTAGPPPSLPQPGPRPQAPRMGPRQAARAPPLTAGLPALPAPSPRPAAARPVPPGPPGAEPPHSVMLREPTLPLPARPRRRRPRRTPRGRSPGSLSLAAAPPSPPPPRLLHQPKNQPFLPRRPAPCGGQPAMTSVHLPSLHPPTSPTPGNPLTPSSPPPGLSVQPGLFHLLPDHPAI